MKGIKMAGDKGGASSAYASSRARATHLGITARGNWKPAAADAGYEDRIVALYYSAVRWLLSQGSVSC